MKIIELYNLKGGLKSPLPSDTLWGNICWAIKYLYGDNDLTGFLDSYSTDQPALIVSSSFPFVRQKAQTIRFFPRPILPFKPFDDIQKKNKDKPLAEKITDMSTRKDQKDITLLDQSFFEKVIQGQADYEDMPSFKLPRIVATSITRNTIDRLRGGTLEINNTGQLFTEDEYFIQYSSGDDEKEEAETGLFFLALDKTDGKLEAALRLLSHIGIGGNRSIGKGAFDFSVNDFEISEPAHPNALINLSLYVPADDELGYYKQHTLLFNYQLEQRKGYYGELQNGVYEKNPVVYFKEGAVFPLPEQQKPVYGKNITENNGAYPVHRYGIGFMLKIFIDEKNYRQ
ncbi:MAG TPA: type III-A CRISPR-associated RAMP protein Csm4 [Chitinophagales bacterium]|nr:type III-A CRISPR-associated RAMP protein Csm4 [Chitinophagales bacterium]